MIRKTKYHKKESYGLSIISWPFYFVFKKFVQIYLLIALNVIKGHNYIRQLSNLDPHLSLMDISDPDRTDRTARMCGYIRVDAGFIFGQTRF